MNSLNALFSIKDFQLKFSNAPAKYVTDFNENYKIIKQDLEILEIFKDNVMIDEDEKVITLFQKNEEVVKKVKEWLYRE